MKKWLACLWKTTPDRNIGYLLFRVAVGLGMLTHGVPKLMAGAETWARLGEVVTAVGLPGPAVFWGFMAAFAESVGAVLLVAGALTPPSAALIAVTMAVAAFVAHADDPFARKELALLYLCACVLFVLKGAGAYSVDALLSRKTGSKN